MSGPPDADRLTVSVRLNNDVSIDRFAEVAVVLDEGGFDQLWISNDLFFNSAFVAITVAATRTKQLTFGTGILNPYTTHPAEMAMFARSFNEIAPGRLRLGVAAGAEDFLSWIGLERHHPLATMRSTINALRYLLTDDGADRPDNWTDEARLRIAAGPNPVPIYLGAMSPRMLALSGELADGALPLLFPPERYHEARAEILAGVEQADRQPAEVDIPACVWCSLADDRDDAIAALAHKIAYYGPSFSPHVLNGLGLEPNDLTPARTALLEGDTARARTLLPSAALQLGIAGRTADIIERVGGLLGQGARHISFGPPLGPDIDTAIRLLRDEVVPALRHGD